MPAREQIAAGTAGTSPAFLLEMRAFAASCRDGTEPPVTGEYGREIVRALVENTGIKDPALYEVMIPSAFEPNGLVNAASLEYDLNYFVSAGYVKDPPTVAQSLDPRFIEYALAVLGRR